MDITRKDDALAGRLAPGREASATDAFRAEFNRQLTNLRSGGTNANYDYIRLNGVANPSNAFSGYGGR